MIEDIKAEDGKTDEYAPDEADDADDTDYTNDGLGWHLASASGANATTSTASKS